MSGGVLVITNLFGYPWDPTRAMFNQQQFDRLAERVRLSVIVPVSWVTVLRKPRAYWNARRDAAQRWRYVDYVIYWHLPGFARSLNAVFFLVSLLVQRLRKLLFHRWDCLIGSWAYPDAVAVSALGRVTGTPVIAKVHGSDINVFALPRLRRWQIRSGLNRCRSVVAVSRALAERLTSIGVDESRVEVVYNGVDEKRFRPLGQADARRELGFDGSKRMILFVGNLLASKGCGDLLDAVAQLAAQRNAPQVVYLGGGPAREELEARARALGLASSVKFGGKVAHETLARWFSAADVFCLPSHNEGLPNVVLEAMACGVPVVATRVGGIPEVLPEFAGILVPARDPRALADALARALDRTWDRGRIVGHASQFGWQSNIDRMCQIIERAKR